MEIHWRSNPVGKVQKNLPFFKEIEKKEFTQNIRYYLITVVAYIANQRLFNFEENFTGGIRQVFADMMKSNQGSIKIVTVGLVCLFLASCATFSMLKDAGVISQVDGKPAVDILALRQLGKRDCGVACLVSVMNHWGKNISQQDVKEKLGDTSNEGYSLGQLQHIAEEYGFAAYVFSGNVEDLKRQCELGRPCIVVYKASRRRNHSVVVYDVKDDSYSFNESQILIMDPANAKTYKLAADVFLSRWNALNCPVLLLAKKEGGKKE